MGGVAVFICQGGFPVRSDVRSHHNASEVDVGLGQMS
jgi:hypothetical protein